MIFKEYVAHRRIIPPRSILPSSWRSAWCTAASTSNRVAGRADRGGDLRCGDPGRGGKTPGQKERWSPIFPNGDLQVPWRRPFGIDFDPQRNFLLLLTVVFALLGMFMIALRRSGYGRRLTATKNSPAVCATSA